MMILKYENEVKSLSQTMEDQNSQLKNHFIFYVIFLDLNILDPSSLQLEYYFPDVTFWETENIRLGLFNVFIGCEVLSRKKNFQLVNGWKSKGAERIITQNPLVTPTAHPCVQIWSWEYDFFSS